MATYQNKEYIKEVTANTEDYVTWVIPSGKTWAVGEWYGSANPQTDCHVCIIWDYDGTPEIVSVTHSEQKHRIDRSFVGDGTKKLAISLRNDNVETEAIAAGFDYKEL